MKNIWKTYSLEFQYGLGMVGLMLLWMIGENILLTFTERPELGNISGTLAIIIPLTGFWMLLNSIAQRDKGLSWKSALRSGTVTAFTMSIVGAVVVYLYILTVPQPIELYLEYLTQQMQSAGTAEAEIAATIEQTRMLFGPVPQGIAAAIGSLITGLVLTLLMKPAISWRLKRKK